MKAAKYAEYEKSVADFLKRENVMKLQTPFEISPRLLPCVRIGDVFISIDYAGETRDGRTRYRYHIDLPNGKEHTGTDLKSGCGGGDLQAGMESLLSFLSAAAESYRYSGMDGENSDLFPEFICQWASDNSDAISMLAIELEETKTQLIEE